MPADDSRRLARHAARAGAPVAQLLAIADLPQSAIEARFRCRGLGEKRPERSSSTLSKPWAARDAMVRAGGAETDRRAAHQDGDRGAGMDGSAFRKLVIGPAAA